MRNLSKTILSFVLPSLLALPAAALAAKSANNNAPAESPAARGNYISLSADYVMPGNAFTVYGYNFKPSEAVTVTAFGNASTAIADNGGSFTSKPITVPATAINTKAAISAKGAASGDTATATLTVGGYYPVVTPNGYFTVPGGQVRFSGHGFEPSEQIVAQDPNGTIMWSRFYADAGGNFMTPPVTVPYKSGEQTYKFLGQDSNADTTVTVNVANTPAYLMLSDYSGRPGSLYRITGFLFGANEHVNLAFQGSSLANVTTDGNGDFVTWARVPYGTDNGFAVITGTGQTTGRKAQIQYMVNGAGTQRATMQSNGQNPRSQISVSSIGYNKSALGAGKTTTTITAAVLSSGANTSNATVRVQLLDTNGQIAAQSTYASQNLIADSPEKFSLTTPNDLPKGNYIIGVTVNSANGSQLASFPNLGTITVR